MSILKHFIGGTRDGQDQVCETAPERIYAEPGDPNLTGPIPEESYDRVRYAEGLAAVYRCIGSPEGTRRDRR